MTPHIVRQATGPDWALNNWGRAELTELERELCVLRDARASRVVPERRRTRIPKRKR